MAKKKQKQDPRKLTLPIATAVVASFAMRDVVRLRRDYPDAVSEKDAQELYDALGAHLREALDDGCFDDVREDLKLDVEFGDANADIELTTICVLVTFKCPGVGLHEDYEKAGKAIDQVRGICQRLAPLPLKELVDQLFQYEILDCRIPEGDPEFSDPRRALQLLQNYWILCCSLVLHQMEAFVALRPHPLRRLIVNLRTRMETYFARLADMEGAKEAASAAEVLLTVLLDDEPDDLSAVPEWTQRQIQIVDEFLECTRIKLGAKNYSLTHQEKLFFSTAERAIAGYHKRVEVAWAQKLKEADRIREENERKARDDRSSRDAAATPASSECGNDSTDKNSVFRHKGDHWEIQFESEVTTIRNGVGSRYIAMLLGNPGESLHAMDMQIMDAIYTGRLDPSDFRKAEETGAEIHRSPAGSGGTVTDRLAVRQYRVRLNQIEVEIETSVSDPARRLELKEEAAAIEQHIRSAIDLRGRPRPSADDDERAKNAVTKAISRTIDRLWTLHRPLAGHLKRHLVTGLFCRYDPEPQVSWITK